MLAAACSPLAWIRPCGLFGFTSTAMTAAGGTTSWSSSSFLTSSVDAKKLTPVVLPPG